VPNPKRPGPAETTKRLITMPQATSHLLDRVGEISRYVRALIEDANREWREALDVVARAGLTADDALAVFDVLGLGYRPLSGLPASLSVGTKLDVADVEESRRERWESLCQQLREDEGLARALVTLSREYWRGNEACREEVLQLSLSRP